MTRWTWQRRLSFSVLALVMSAIVASSSFTTYRALSRTVTVKVCGHSYQVRAGQALTVSINGPTCADVKVSGR